MADLGNLIATLLGFIAVVVWSIRKLRRDDNDKWLVGVPLLYSLAAVGVASHGVRFSEDSVQSLHYTAIAGSLFLFSLSQVLHQNLVVAFSSENDVTGERTRGGMSPLLKGLLLFNHVVIAAMVILLLSSTPVFFRIRVLAG
ncbi:hypothetical protein [Rubinisphaera brasiliensis]|uniref:Uncharacterized protein n=1 Tax=Rubinisphaera brasiliensis (strain ATCC 49424 / DSM 5305 / JCM 21570 / IAM 15109 / NBRC 103401 / IFAM 1448) TaxID=756272 RepID=F0SGV8_RUBBR|nr:hypothetical protein [Rubinisphaera brasiliensis]ADY58393.1 hypothetical protein Plabr_0769 [Rubinisphaera brasiliensis DSM 5305]